jgi:hypothetical protein
LVKAKDCFENILLHPGGYSTDFLDEIKEELKHTEKNIKRAEVLKTGVVYLRIALDDIKTLDTNPDVPSLINRAHFYLDEGIELLEHPEGRTLEERFNLEKRS